MCFLLRILAGGWFIHWLSRTGVPGALRDPEGQRQVSPQNRVNVPSRGQRAGHRYHHSVALVLQR